MNTEIIETLEREVRIARKALHDAEISEHKSGYDIDATIDRANIEGQLEGLEWALKLASGEASNAN